MVSNPVVQFAAYEFLTARLLASRRRRTGPGGGALPARLSAGEAFAAGAAAKLAATLMTYPMLTLKSRQQMHGPGGGGDGAGGSEGGAHGANGGGGLLRELLTILRDEGVGARCALPPALSPSVLARGPPLCCFPGLSSCHFSFPPIGALPRPRHEARADGPHGGDPLRIEGAAHSACARPAPARERCAAQKRAPRVLTWEVQSSPCLCEQRSSLLSPREVG